MGYSIGLKTKSKKQSAEILEFIEKNIPKITSINAYERDVLWTSDDNLHYLKDNNYIGINYKCSSDLLDLYFFSLIYIIGQKFNLTENFNGINCVVLNYDDQETYYLSKENPFNQETDNKRFLSFIKIKDNGLSESYKEKSEKFELFKASGMFPSDEEINILENIIKVVKQAK